MLFNYKAIEQDGKEKAGKIEAATADIAISTLQRRGLVVINVTPAESVEWWNDVLPFGKKVSQKELVIMSRQAATLFEAQVSAIKVFTLLADNAQNRIMRVALEGVIEDIKGGISISAAMAKQPKVFSDFFVSMVAAGEESGKLTEVFNFLAAHLERSYALSSKTKNALVYPAFIVVTFVVVMVLMLVKVIPQLSQILIESGQELPIYTKIVVGISDFFVHYGWVLLLVLVGLGIYAWRAMKTEKGKMTIDKFKLQIPLFGELYQKTYLARIADNINTMTDAGIPVVRTLEIAADTVDNEVYSNILLEALDEIKAGKTIADAFEKYEEMPSIMVQMVRVGEETGSLGDILKTLARFYTQEVNNTIDTLIGLIEPAMIVFLGAGVAILLASVLIPIYNVASSI